MKNPSQAENEKHWNSLCKKMGVIHRYDETRNHILQAQLNPTQTSQCWTDPKKYISHQGFPCRNVKFITANKWSCEPCWSPIPPSKRSCFNHSKTEVDDCVSRVLACANQPCQNQSRDYKSTNVSFGPNITKKPACCHDCKSKGSSCQDKATTEIPSIPKSQVTSNVPESTPATRTSEKAACCGDCKSKGTSCTTPTSYLTPPCVTCKRPPPVKEIPKCCYTYGSSAFNNSQANNLCRSHYEPQAVLVYNEEQTSPRWMPTQPCNGNSVVNKALPISVNSGAPIRIVSPRPTNGTIDKIEVGHSGMTMQRDPKRAPIQEQCGINITYPGRTEYMDRYQRPVTIDKTSPYIINKKMDFGIFQRPMGCNGTLEKVTEYQDHYLLPHGKDVIKCPWMRK